MKRAVLFVFLIACLVLATSPCLKVGLDTASAADAHGTSLGLPAANIDNIDPDSLVPLSIAKRIALKKAKELWGQVTPGEPIACCDQDGDISTYMWPFRIGGGPFPRYEEIMQGVREGRRLVKEAEEGFFSPESSKPGEESADRPGLEQRSLETEAGTYASTPYPAESELSGGTTLTHREKSEESQSFQEMLKKAREKELGIGEYGTIYVSARYDLYPIPLCSHYLCPYYIARLGPRKGKEGFRRNTQFGSVLFSGPFRAIF